MGMRVEWLTCRRPVVAPDREGARGIPRANARRGRRLSADWWESVHRCDADASFGRRSPWPAPSARCARSRARSRWRGADGGAEARCEYRSLARRSPRITAKSRVGHRSDGTWGMGSGIRAARLLSASPQSPVARWPAIPSPSGWLPWMRTGPSAGTSDAGATPRPRSGGPILGHVRRWVRDAQTGREMRMNRSPSESPFRSAGPPRLPEAPKDDFR